MLSPYFTPDLHGEPVLTYWSGTISTSGYGCGFVTILNGEKKKIHEIPLPDEHRHSQTAFESAFPSYIDLHEDTITEQGNVFVMACNTTQSI